ncbi:ASCH/PUA domain-containing protein [Spirosoma sp.]|uniref:ASCH/PUA domain-containing protein n=1 Tax=Spirosoma sp. TaxID=1899569 RepID=UPI002639037C|nr:ASCH/PUA domain-containing protein [Spirosoma sp.]MCX6216582.1 DUF3850 domain-containing protein [Spirosoma sp.]
MKLATILTGLVLTPGAISKLQADVQNLQTIFRGKQSQPVKKNQTEPKTHNLKVWPEHFNRLASGEKPFEVRRNDRGFKAGDMLRLSEYNPQTGTYTGRSLFASVTYVLEETQFGLKKGFAALGIRLIQNEFKRV